MRQIYIFLQNNFAIIWMTSVCQGHEGLLFQKRKRHTEKMWDLTLTWFFSANKATLKGEKCTTAFFQTHNWDKSWFFNAAIRMFAWIYANITKCPFLTLKCNWSTNSPADSKPSLINGFCGASFRPFKFLNVPNSDDLTNFFRPPMLRPFIIRAAKINQSMQCSIDAASP